MIKSHRNIVKLSAVLLFSFLFISADNTTDSSRFINPGFRINSEGDDFSPSITADGNTMVFNSKKPEEKSHNIFICRKEKGIWGDPVPLFELCTDSNEETPFISADGKTILFASDRPGGFSPPMTADGNKRITFDIYISRYTDGRWSDPEALKGNINTTMNERSPSISRDGKLLFFTRWPYKNMGKSRIYMAELQNGKYITASELPESINSGNFEVGFIPSYKENRYYFSSMRNGGTGGWDIYYTTLTSTGFTQPLNAGTSINTVFDDLYFAEAESDFLICSNIFGGLGGYDIYVRATSARVQESVTSRKTAYSKQTMLKVTLHDSLSGKLLKDIPLRIKLITNAEDKKSGVRTVDAKTDSAGKFEIYPKSDVRWLSLEPLAPDYAGCSIRIKVIPGQYQDVAAYLKRSQKEKVIKENRAVAPEKKTITEKKILPDTPDKDEYSENEFKSIFFDFSSSKIKTDEIPGLYKVIEYMRINSSSKILITGYADSTGTRKINNRISYARALSVKRYMTGMGIESERINIRGAGEIQKRDKHASGEKNSRFRRADFRIIE